MSRNSAPAWVRMLADEDVARIADAALKIALYPPADRSHHDKAYIAWSLIEELRDAIGASGFDMKKAIADLKKWQRKVDAQRRKNFLEGKPYPTGKKI